MAAGARNRTILGRVDRWLAREFAPHRLAQTIRDLAAAQQPAADSAGRREQAAREMEECDRKLAQYRAALDVGASPATVAAWIAETEAERARHEITLRQATTRMSITEDQIEQLVAELGDVAAVLRDANPDDKSEVYQQLVGQPPLGS